MFEVLSPVHQGVEELLPAHMMSLTLERLVLEGWEVRLDTRGYLNNSMAATIKKYPGHEIDIAKLVDKVAMDVLRLTSFDDAETAAMAVSMVMCKLVEEKLYLDFKNQGVLSAMQILADAREDDNPDLAPKWKIASEKAGKMMNEIFRQGFYKHTAVKS